MEMIQKLITQLLLKRVVRGRKSLLVPRKVIREPHAPDCSDRRSLRKNAAIHSHR